MKTVNDTDRLSPSTLHETVSVNLASSLAATAAAALVVLPLLLLAAVMPLPAELAAIAPPAQPGPRVQHPLYGLVLRPCDEVA